jgi:hypothetical protein
MKLVYENDLKINLFNAERNFSMYVPDSFTEAKRLPALKTTPDLSQLAAVKNKLINGPHAILAWLGALFGFSTIAESIKHPDIFSFIKEAIENEILPILRREYPSISINELQQIEASFFDRCLESTNDPVIRVGRDPLRKINNVKDTIALARKHHLPPTSRLEKGIAAGFLYGIKGIDSNNHSCKKIMDIYNENNNSYMAVICYRESVTGGNLIGLNPYKDRNLIDNILDNMNSFNAWYENKQAINPLQSANTLISTHQEARSISIPKILYSNYDNFLFRSVAKKLHYKPEKKSITNALIEIAPPQKKVGYPNKDSLWHSAFTNEKRQNSGNVQKNVMTTKLR